MNPVSPLSDDARYAVEKLFPELTQKWVQWSKEYRDPRLLGPRAEFVEIHRKTQKLKLAFWDGVDTSDWRESPRQILFELASHAFLAIKDLDADSEAITQPFTPKPAVGSVIFEEGTGKFWCLNEDRLWEETCGPECDERHTYRRGCAQQQERKQELDADDPNAEF